MTTDLEARVRATLRAVADATPFDPVADVADLTDGADGPAGASRRPRWLAAVAAAAVLAGAVGVAATLGRGDGRSVTSRPEPAAPSSSTGLPEAFDLTTAAPLFSVPGDAGAVADAYLRSRFPDYPAPDVRRREVRDDGGTATARWSSEVTAGDIHLRRVGPRWAVVAATTDDVDLGDVAYDGERVTGTIRSTNVNSLFADVLDPAGEPGDDAVRPNGQPDAAYRFGTAGGPANGELTLRSRHAGSPAVLRVNLVGGTILSISELQVDPPVERSTILGTSDGPGPIWELVATDTTAGHVVSLRAPGLHGVFTLDTDGAFDTLFTVIGPCCRLDDDVVVLGALRRDVESAVLVVAADTEIPARMVTDPATGVRYAVVLVRSGGPPTGRMTLVLADGTSHDAAVDLDLSTVGG